MTQNREASVRIRFVRIEIDNREIGGICLDYASRSAAYSFFEAVHRYLTATSTIERAPMSIRFDTATDGYAELLIEFGLGDTYRIINVHGIEASIITSIKRSLEMHARYLVLAGFTNEEGVFQLLPFEENHLFRTEVLINGMLISGKRLK